MVSRSSVLTASITARSVVVEASGVRFTIPPKNASSWILALASEDPITAVFPGLLSSEDYDTVIDMLADELMEVTDIRSASFKATSEASGMKWWEALRLVGMADSSDVMGSLTLKGVDPAAIPFGRWCSAVFALAISGLEEKERAKWESKLSFPPPLAEAMEEAAESGSFEDMVKGFRGMPGARLG